MWKTPGKSPATTVAVSETPGSARSDFLAQQPIAFPNIIAQNPEYSRLYEKIYKSQEKAYESITEEEQKDQLNNIKDTITKKLLQQAKQKSFNKKFGKMITPSLSSRKVLKNTHRSLIGLTKKQQNNQKLLTFLMDHRKAVQLQEQARLVQYHLRDKQKIKWKIDYINRTELTDKHRRTAPHSKDRQQKLFKINNEMNYHLLRKTAYIRNDKLMSQSLATAKNNPTYCRMNNFSQIQYILHEDNCNLMVTREIPQDREKEARFNGMRRLFLAVALASEAMRTYYQYVRERDFGRVVDLVMPWGEEERVVRNVTREYVMGMIGKIIKYKQMKVIHFEDFIEILTTIKQQRGYDVLQAIRARQSTPNPPAQKLLSSPLDTLLTQPHPQIPQTQKSSNIQTLLHKLYTLHQTKIIGHLYLPPRDIIQLMKGIGLVPKKVTMNKFVYYLCWYQRRREGFAVGELVDVLTAVGVDLGGVGGLEGFFGGFDVRGVMGGVVGERGG